MRGEKWLRCLVCGVTLWWTGCSTSPPPSATPTPTGTDRVRRLEADVSFLAADTLEGRGTPSRGLDLAALYLEAQLRSAAVEPALTGSYRQPYKIGEYRPGEAALSVRIDGKLIPPENYIFWNIGRDPAAGAIDLALVDAGYGVVAEERNVNDLEGLDLRGKAVVARKGASWPLDASSVFGPDRALGKLMAATVRGASMLVYLSPDLDASAEAEAGFLREMKNAAVAFVREPGLGQASALNPLLVLKPQALASVLGSDVDRMTKGPLGKRIQITMQPPVREATAANVLGRIRGTDPSLREEWIVLSAHYDHIGSHTVPEGKDGIWNGADDNASGTAAVLEIARSLAERRGKRSVLAFFTSGEDRGIFGSAYYAAHPVVPMAQVVLQINLDMIGRSQGQVQAIADCAPALFQRAVELAKKHNIQLIPDQQPSWRLIYLTDNYPFAKSQVPGIHFFTGLHPDYHQPTDTADKIRYQEMSKIVEVALELTRIYLEGEPKPPFTRPAWFLTP